MWRSAKREWLLRKVWAPGTVDRSVCGVEGNSNSGAAGMALVKYPVRRAGKVGVTTVYGHYIRYIPTYLYTIHNYIVTYLYRGVVAVEVGGVWIFLFFSYFFFLGKFFGIFCNTGWK